MAVALLGRSPQQGVETSLWGVMGVLAMCRVCTCASMSVQGLRERAFGMQSQGEPKRAVATLQIFMRTCAG